MKFLPISLVCSVVSAFTMASCTAKKNQNQGEVKTVMANEGNSITGTYALFHIEKSQGSPGHFCIYSAEISKLNSPINLSNPTKAPSPDVLMKWALKTKRVKLDTPRSFSMPALRATFERSSLEYTKKLLERAHPLKAEVLAYKESVQNLDKEIAEWDVAVQDLTEYGHIRIGEGTYRRPHGGITVSDYTTVAGQRNRAVRKYNKEEQSIEKSIAELENIPVEARRYEDEMMESFNVLQVQAKYPSLEEVRTLNFIRGVQESLVVATKAGVADGAPCEGPASLLPKFK